MKKIAFVVNSPDYFVSHRMPIGLALLKQGNEVHLIGPGEYPKALLGTKFKFHSITMSRNGINIVKELFTIFQLLRLFLVIKPDLVHLVTIKPYLYGGIVARLARVPAVVSAVAGLGTIFINNTVRIKAFRAVLWFVYRFALGHSNQAIIFQNKSDASLIKKWIGIPSPKINIIRGSGVDLERYSYTEEQKGTPIVALVSRLLTDKGVLEFVEASRILKSRNLEVRMCLVGEIDEGNKTSVTNSQVSDWVKQQLIEAWGHREDVEWVYAESNLACLPSYREGLPKSLIEAAACGRAVVTTNVPGCRDAIEPNVTGLLVPVADSRALANAIQDLIENSDKRASMGREGRILAEAEFSIGTIVDAHLKIYTDLLSLQE